MKQVISYADVVLFKWVKNFLLAFLLMQLLQLAFYLFSSIFPFLTSYVGNWWYFFSFAIIFYYIAITGYSNSIETKVPFKLNLLANKPQLLLQSSFQFNVPDNSYPAPEIIEIEQVEIEKKEDKLLMVEWKSKITALLQGEKVYHDPELSLTQLAKMLKTNPSVISKVINQGFQLNFNDYINQYRVEAVKEKLQAGEQKLQTLLSIAFDCGFNSKATFNRAFKKNTGFTPKDWIDRK